jgi:hypothetical protein
MNNLNFVRIDVTANDGNFDELYNTSAFTMIGCPEDHFEYILHEYLSDDDTKPEDVKMGGLQEVEGNVSYYVFKGKEMNKRYHLKGDNAYADDLTFLSIPCKYFKEIGKLAMFKLAIDPQRMRWFDDIVDNNKRR